MRPWADSIHELASRIASLTEGLAAALIGLAVLQATLYILLRVLRTKNTSSSGLVARLQLGRWLSLALEFLLAADILRTAIAPTWNDIGQLAAIATLRTLLNYFLERDIDKNIARGSLDVPGSAAQPRSGSSRQESMDVSREVA